MRLRLPDTDSNSNSKWLASLKYILYVSVVNSHWIHWNILHLITWTHFPRRWPLVRGINRSPVTSLHKGQWRGALMFPLICAWINGWANNREAGGLRRYRTNFDVIVMILSISIHLWEYIALEFSRLFDNIAAMISAEFQDDWNTLSNDLTFQSCLTVLQSTTMLVGWLLWFCRLVLVTVVVV